MWRITPNRVIVIFVLMICPSNACCPGLSASPNVYTLYIIFVSYLFIDLTPCPIISCTLVLHFEVFSIFQLSFCFIFLRLCDVVVCILFFGYLPCCVVCCDIMCRCGLWHRTLHICPVTPDVLSFPICEYVIICPFINPIASGTFFLCDCSCCIRLWISKVGFWSFFSYLLLFLFLFPFFSFVMCVKLPYYRKLHVSVVCICGAKIYLCPPSCWYYSCGFFRLVFMCSPYLPI